MEIKGPVSFASLRHYVKLPVLEELFFEEMKRITGLKSDSTLRQYIVGDWIKSGLMEKRKLGRRDVYIRLNDTQHEEELADELSKKGFTIIGRYKKEI